MVSIWLGTELAITWHLFKSQSTPKYVYECFQLNLAFSNMWFIWVLLIGLSGKP